MADQLYLSYTLRKYSEENMLRHYEKLLKLFPFSRLARNASTFKVIPVYFTEPAGLFHRQQRLMQLLREIFAGLRPKQACFHWQRIIQIVNQLEQALDIGLDHARAVRQLRLRKKISVDAKLNFERAARPGAFRGTWKFRDGTRLLRVDTGVALIEFRTETAQRHARRLQLPLTREMPQVPPRFQPVTAVRVLKVLGRGQNIIDGHGRRLGYLHHHRLAIIHREHLER